VEMNDPKTSLKTGFRVAVTTAALVPVVLSTAVGSVLMGVPTVFPNDVLDWLKLVFGAVLLAFASLVLTFMPWIVKVVWRQPRNEDEVRFLDFLRWIGRALKSPRRIASVVAVLTVIWPLAIFIQDDTELERADKPLIILAGEEIVGQSGKGLGRARKVLIDQWNLMHPEAKAEFKEVPGGSTAEREVMIKDAKAKEGEGVDIYALDVVWMKEFVENDFIRPLDRSRQWYRQNEDDFIDKVWLTCTFGTEVLWGLPFNTDAGLLYSRTSTTRNADRAKTRDRVKWKDYFPASANAGERFKTEALTVIALEAIWAHGGNLVNDGKLVLNEQDPHFDQGTKRALIALRNVYGSKKRYNTDPEDDATTRFKRSPYMRNWPVAYHKLKDDAEVGAFDVDPLPHATVLGGQNLVMSKHTTRPRAAQALIEFLTSPSSQLILFETGGYAPTREYVYDVSRQPHALDLRKAVFTASRRPVTAHYRRFSEEFRVGVDEIISGTREPDGDLARKLVKAFYGVSEKGGT
jgi:multiple sugar transport system substrate-binding protein